MIDLPESEHVKRAVAAAMFVTESMERGDVAEFVGHALLSAEFLGLAMDASSDGDKTASEWLINAASVEARSFAAAKAEAENPPTGLTGATESDATPPPVPEVPPERNHGPTGFYL